jgi:hypothetical protein
MSQAHHKQQIQTALTAFAQEPLAVAGRGLLATLGYRSEKRFDLVPNTTQTFLINFVQHRHLDQAQALFDQWRSVDFLFQLTDDEIRQHDQLTLFESKGQWSNAIIESYLFFAIELTGDQYTRSQLASITRAVNRLFEMPALLLFKHGAALTLAVINRRPNRGVIPLPNLETRFVAANSLLAVNRPLQMAFRNPQVETIEEALAEVRRRHFEARTPKTKERYRQKDANLRQQLAALLEKDGWPADQANRLATWNPYDQNAYADFFDPEWMFGVDEGYDVVVGNPPYVRQEQIREYKPHFQKQYTCYTGTADLYVYFFERGIRLLREQGVLSYICSNKYFRAGYGEKLRAFLNNQTTIRQLIDFGDAPVFTAIAYPSIIVTRKIPARTNQVRILNWEMGPPIAEFAHIFQQNSTAMEQKKLDDKGWQLEAPEVLRLLEKLRKAGKPLGEYVNGRFYYGIKTGLNEAFVVDRATRDRLIAEHPSSAEVLKPYLRGRDVKRWRVEFDEQYLIKIESSENKKHPWSSKSEREAEQIFARCYPAIHAHFQQYRDGLIKRDDQGKYFWELRSCVYWAQFEVAKIICPDIYEHQSFAIDSSGFYSGNTSYFIPTHETWLCGLFNSQVVEWFYSKVSNKVRGGYLRAFTDYMIQIPIPELNFIHKQQIESIVNRILTAKRADPAANVSALEAEIDRLVYQRYGLTEEEIALVEARGIPGMGGGGVD